MEDDNTIKLTKGDISSNTETTSNKIGSTSSSPELSTLFQSSKEIASLESSASFRSISTSTDLKALLPQREMKWRTLDKYGRRVQKIEEDGIESIEEVGSSCNNDDMTGSTTDTAASKVGSTSSSPELSTLFQSSKEIASLESSANFRSISTSSDLKALLPTRKIEWKRLDKFGRRGKNTVIFRIVFTRLFHNCSPFFVLVHMLVERVGQSDETSTVGPSSSRVVAIESMLPKTEEAIKDEETQPAVKNPREVDANEQFLVDLLKVGDSNKLESPPKSSKNLKDMLPNKQTWTKLDFKGVGVEGVSRTKQSPASKNNTDSSLKALLLQSKKPTWTKLDFHGVGVEDESRTKRAPVAQKNIDSSLKALTLQSKKPIFTKLDFHGVGVIDESRTKRHDTEDFNKGEYTDLKTLLPERKIQWGTRGKSVSISDSNVDIDLDTKNKGVSLKTLLPEKKVTWRNEESRSSK